MLFFHALSPVSRMIMQFDIALSKRDRNFLIGTARVSLALPLALGQINLLPSAVQLPPYAKVISRQKIHHFENSC